MTQLPDTSAIQRLVRGARVRIRTQWALEGATTATVIAAAMALVSIFAVRVQTVAPTTGIYLLIASGAVIVLGALVSASRRLDDERVARRIDRASNLSDRLSTAIAFERALRAGAPVAPDTTHELMYAAIRDGVRAAPRANLRAAAPFAIPKDWKAALGFLAVSALAAGLAIPEPDRTPRLFRANPDRERPGKTVSIEGENLMIGVAAPIASRGARAVFGASNVPAAATTPTTGYVPRDTSVVMGTTEAARPVSVLDWTGTEIRVRIPDDAPIGPTKLIVYVGGQSIGAVDFEVVSKKDKDFFDPEAVDFDPDEKQYIETILRELRNVAQRDAVPELDEFANELKDLLEKAENGEITKQQLLDELAKAEQALNKDAEPDQAEIDKQLGEIGKELAKQDLTKQLGEALQKQDLQKAKEELEKLADKLDKKQLGDKQKEELGKQLEKVAEHMAKQEQERQQKQRDAQKQAEDQIQNMEKEIRRLEQKQDPKSQQQKQDMERRLEQKKRELEKLKKDEEQKQQSEQRRAVKRLQKDLEKAAENLQKPQKNPDQQDGDQERKDQQASRSLKDAARETGRVDKDRRKQAAQKKVSSQMDDLREAMRRAKQRGNKGPNDPFNKNGKNQDFIARARGQKGSGQAWKPGQGQGQGQGQNGGQGNGSGQQSNTWGTGHDDNLVGDPTHKSGNTRDQDLQGQQGNEGGSTRETILAAAQKGFASKRYQKVYQDYQRIVEEVMRTEKLPSSYKYYVKRYFAKIHPSMTPEGEPGGASPPRGSDQ
jgi:hypothetical protein